MILYINTIKDDAEKIELKVIKDGTIIMSAVEKARAQQSEKLIPTIIKVLHRAKVDIKKIKKIKIENSGGSFTALRIGVTTANALGYALNIPVVGTIESKVKQSGFDVVEPIYNKNPDITISKKRLLED